MDRKHFRFSLATLLLVATIVCLCAALWASSMRLRHVKQELKAAEARVEKYRGELGYLTIEDPSTLHWIRVRRPGDLQWQWRVHVPEANRFWINAANDRIPSLGTATVTTGGIALPAGEMTVSALVSRDRNGRRTFRVELHGVPGLTLITNDMEGAHAEWLDDGGWACDAGDSRTEMAEAGEDAVLVRLRAGPILPKTDALGRPGSEFTDPDGPTPGLMVWISDSKKRKGK
jgi:hypothetical protein